MEVAVEVQAEVNKTASRLRDRKRRIFIVISFRKVITLNPYVKINNKPHCAHSELSLTVVESYAILGSVH